ncbi:MAG TPA: DUF4136 domain-containing protein [Thermoanaerobaculia bacterium]|nr:DUF4136 domain-containing protein [Thermoanaerobaculia bacterium]
MRRILATLALAAVLAGCSSLTTNADYNPATDFSKYKTWAWHETESMKDTLWRDRVKTAVSDELRMKGLVPSESNPDLWVVAHVRLDEQTQINTYNTGWGYGWGWGYGAGMTTSTVSQIPVGTLIVDLVDVSQKQMVWRGTATKTLSPDASPESKQKNLQEAVSKMFANFPPKK